MMRIKANPIWLARSLTIPGLGVVRRLPGSFAVTDEQGAWLIRNRYAKRVDVPIAEEGAPAPTATEPPASEPDRAISPDAVEYCNVADLAELTAIKGISPTTAKAVVEARDPDPLTAVQLLELLSDRQVSAIEKHLA